MITASTAGQPPPSTTVALPAWAHMQVVKQQQTAGEGAMPTMSKHELLTVVRDLWGFRDAPLDEQAKKVLAEQLIREAWEHGNK